MKLIIRTVLLSLAMLSTLVTACAASEPSIKTFGNGGMVVVEVAPGCPSTDVFGVTLSALEDPNFHKTAWKQVAVVPEPVNGAFVFKWDTTACHNNTYTLKAQFKTKDGPLSARTKLSITNLSIFSADPANALINKDGEGRASLTLTLADNDLTDPMDVVVTLYDMDDHTKPIRTLTAKGQKGDKVTLVWDLKDSKGKMTEPACYTFEVHLSQADESEYAGKALTVQDSCTYRSKYLTLDPVKDKKGKQITEWEFVGYLDNGTTSEADDTFRYNSDICVRDSQGVSAVTGRQFLADPIFEHQINFNLAELTCLIHKRQDCLLATEKGLVHRLAFKVPVECMQYAGNYFGYLELFDGHAADYRDHAMRRALNR